MAAAVVYLRRDKGAKSSAFSSANEFANPTFTVDPSMEEDGGDGHLAFDNPYYGEVGTPAMTMDEPGYLDVDPIYHSEA